jgi:hypothetical protein
VVQAGFRPSLVTAAATVDSPARFSLLGQPESTVSWDGSLLQLVPPNGAAMAPTPNGSMIFAYQNMSAQNNAGKLMLASGAGKPLSLASPALISQPRVLIQNWAGNNLTVTNVSLNPDTPIAIEAYGPGIGPTPTPLPIGSPVNVSAGGTLQGNTNPNWMQLALVFHTSQLALFGIIGGPPDASGNNAYAVALNSPSGDTGPGTGKSAPQGYFATTGGNTWSWEFNWGAAVIFVAYFGAGTVVVPMAIAGVEMPTVTLISL